MFDIKSLIDGINAKISGSAFATDVGNRYYFVKAPQKTGYPYCEFNKVINTHDFQFSNNGQSETIRMQFDIFDSNRNPTTAMNAFKDLTTLMDDTTLTVTGYTCKYVTREWDTGPMWIDEISVNQVSVQYVIRLEP